MRHQKKKHKLNVSTSAHRKSLLKNLSSELIDHGRIKTTISRCKAVKPYVEKLITLAKDDSVANRRLAFARLANKDAVKKLFSEVGPKFKERPGGYTRILRLPDGRVGDNAKVGFIALVD
jgi:large subunit ribosomal protein L17